MSAQHKWRKNYTYMQRTGKTNTSKQLLVSGLHIHKPDEYVNMKLRVTYLCLVLVLLVLCIYSYLSIYLSVYLYMYMYIYIHM